MKEFSFLEFIRDIGKHLTVNYMMAKESVKKHADAQSALKAAEEAKAALMSENESLKSQIAEAQKKLDAAVSDLTGAPPAVSPLPEPSYP